MVAHGRRPYLITKERRCEASAIVRRCPPIRKRRVRREGPLPTGLLREPTSPRKRGRGRLALRRRPSPARLLTAPHWPWRRRAPAGLRRVGPPAVATPIINVSRNSASNCVTLLFGMRQHTNERAISKYPVMDQRSDRMHGSEDYERMGQNFMHLLYAMGEGTILEPWRRNLSQTK